MKFGFVLAFALAATTAEVGAFQAAPGRAATHVRPAASNLAATIPMEVDEAALFAASSFPIKPDKLIERAKEVLVAGIGVKDGGACLSDTFEFVAAVVGPIGKTEYLEALGTFKLEEAFPDIDARYHLFRVDPLQPNRVYFHGRTTATHTGPLLGKPATNKALVLPPQCYHIDFNEDGKVEEFGFYVLDRRQGNTGGLGGAFAFFYGVGQPLPIPECQPYRPSLQFRFLQAIGKLGRRIKQWRASSKKESSDGTTPATA